MLFCSQALIDDKWRKRKYYLLPSGTRLPKELRARDNRRGHTSLELAVHCAEHEDVKKYFKEAFETRRGLNWGEMWELHMMHRRNFCTSEKQYIRELALAIQRDCDFEDL